MAQQQKQQKQRIINNAARAKHFSILEKQIEELGGIERISPILRAELFNTRYGSYFYTGDRRKIDRTDLGYFNQRLYKSYNMLNTSLKVLFDKIKYFDSQGKRVENRSLGWYPILHRGGRSDTITGDELMKWVREEFRQQQAREVQVQDQQLYSRYKQKWEEINKEIDNLPTAESPEEKDKLRQIIREIKYYTGREEVYLNSIDEAIERLKRLKTRQQRQPQRKQT